MNWFYFITPAMRSAYKKALQNGTYNKRFNQLFKILIIGGIILATILLIGELVVNH